MLKLLELHHRQLGQILKDAHSKPSKSTEGQKVQSQTELAGENREKNQVLDSGIHPPRLSRTGRNTGRDLSSSIASNLATARGIPSAKQKRTIPVSPLVSNEHADGTFTQDPAGRKPRAPKDAHASSRPSWTPPESVGMNTKPEATLSDAPFQQFYNKFEGLLSTLTAPLAFASLPLTQATSKEANPTNTSPAPQSSKPRTSKAAPPSPNPDYSSLISSAALRAVRDNNPVFKPHESFIHVPASGGTMSYADITAQAYIDRQVSRQEHAHTRHSSTTSMDDFVDASSQILPDRVLGTSNQPKFNGKTMEELQLENTVLKRTTNDLARRLLTFELNAQNTSAALAHSIRSLQLSPVTTPENSRGKTIAVSGGQHSSDAPARIAQKRVQELEEVLRKYDRKLNKREEENAKLKETLSRYREKWEGLKAGAKARREQPGAGERSRKGSGQVAGTTSGQGSTDVRDGDTAKTGSTE